MTALRVAKGLAGKIDGRIAVIDTEAGSASKYADRIPFDVDDLKRKTVDDYIGAMSEAAKAGYKVLVIDSLSHAWRELTEEVDRITQSGNSKNSILSWGKVSPKQKRLVEAILNYPGHVIATMRSKTEWVVGEGKNGKTAPEKMGLSPEQGKGIEYEFDLLLELNQRHVATVTKDRTGRFQDESIDRPGEDFGIALHGWLTGGKEEAVTVKEPVSSLPDTKPKAAETGNLRELGDSIVGEIGGIITSVNGNEPYFSENEKEEARQIIRNAKLDSRGISELGEFKMFLSEELARRETVKGKAA